MNLRVVRFVLATWLSVMLTACGAATAPAAPAGVVVTLRVADAEE